MLSKIWATLKELAAQKKFQAAVLAGVAWAVGKFGLQVSSEQLAPIVGPLWLYIFGQGLADFGKSAAQISAPKAGP
jgi:hypothetical protein